MGPQTLGKLSGSLSVQPQGHDPLTINDATVDMHQIAKDHGWWDEPATFGDRIALIHSEASEALEEYRNNGFNGIDGRPIYIVNGKPDGVPIELADIVIRVMDFFGSQGWDLEQAIRMKADYNRQRPYRHGGKKI